jgi:sulfhydrogenase subunit beta (sulfur reductase)
MNARTIRKERLPEWVDALLESYEVIAPRNDLSLEPIDSGSQVLLDLHNTVKSPKELFFAAREPLCTYKVDREGASVTNAEFEQGKPRVLFAARPCDVASLPILDKLFSWDYQDAFYQARRESTTIVSLACDQPDETCFCTSVGGSPTGEEGTDILLTPLGDVYHVRAVSERGATLVEQHVSLFDDATAAHEAERERLTEAWNNAVTKTLDTSGLEEALSFDASTWETLTPHCVDCGACTFLCPTCHCFDIQDEGKRRHGERVRLWDSCAFKDFTRMPHGQPRPNHYRRYRQRLMHKFKYYPENFERILCVGCGRCIEHCPAGVDITDALNRARATG